MRDRDDGSVELKCAPEDEAAVSAMPGLGHFGPLQDPATVAPILAFVGIGD